LRGYKRALYDGGIRVPMIARWPGHVEAGSVNHFAWANWDFLPTAAELVGAEVPAEIDGISVVPALIGEDRAGRPQPEHEYLYWEFHERGFSQAARIGDFKGVRRGLDADVEVYDLATDIGEQTNVAAEHPQLVARIEDLFSTARTESEHWPVNRGNQQQEGQR
jgi:arylsulfatase A-like enzyme